MRIIIAITLGLSVLALSACSKPQWKEYDYPAFGFGVSFQTQPTVTETPSTPTTPHSVQAEATQEGVNLVAIAIDPQTTGKSDADVLAGIPDQMVRGSQGTVKSNAPVSAGQLAGREIVIDHGDTTERARVFVLNGRIYQIVARAPSDDEGTVATTFLNSFHLLAK